MSSLRDIRRQLRSVENIKKITDTMERVAAARLRQAQISVEQSGPYIARLKEILERIAASARLSHPLFEKRTAKKIGVVIVSADRGLSGSYNSTILQKADKFLEKMDPEQVELILLGRKGIEYFKKKKWKIRYQLPKWVDKRSLDDISRFSGQLVKWFLSKELDEVWIIYTHYISILKRKVIIEKFLNIGIPQEENNENKYFNYIFEPDLEAILDQILPMYCLTRVQTALYESYASELAARIVAMQTASKNSEEMITRLTLKKNKIRQAEITREMIEITSGAEGLK